MLTSQHIIIPTIPDPILKELALSTPPIIGVITDPANNTCPALSKILESLSNCFLVSIGFFTLSQFFTSVYDNLEFVYVSSGGELLELATGLK